MFGNILILLIAFIIFFIHGYWLINNFSSYATIFVILSIIFFTIIFLDHFIYCKKEDIKYEKLSIENLSKLKNTSIFNQNNRAYHLLINMSYHPIFYI